MAKVQRVTSFFLALFLLITSVGAVFLVIKQTNDQRKTDATTAADTAATDKAKQEAAACSVPDNLKSVAPSSPEDVYKVTNSPTELEQTDVKEGDGATVKLNDCIVVNYRLSLPDGSLVSGNDTFTTGTPVAFPLKEGGLIEGWIKGIPGMKVGGIRRLVVPAAQGYGATGSCSAYDDTGKTCKTYAIPPNSALVFDVQLLDIR